MIIEPYQWHTVAIKELQAASADTVSIMLERPEGYAFRAGQYTIFRFASREGQRVMRQYSFSSAPAAPYLECTIQREPGGEASEWLFARVQQGDTLEISQPFGSFFLSPQTNRPLLFIAGRVGIAPFMSLIREHEEEKQNISVLYSVHTADQICFRDELSALSTIFFITRSSGRISRESIAPHIASHPIVYLCGSRSFVEAMQQHVSSLGVAPEDIKRELFTL